MQAFQDYVSRTRHTWQWLVVSKECSGRQRKAIPILGHVSD